MTDGKNGIMNKMKHLQKIIFICENSLNFMVVFLFHQKKFLKTKDKKVILCNFCQAIGRPTTYFRVGCFAEAHKNSTVDLLGTLFDNWRNKCFLDKLYPQSMNSVPLPSPSFDDLWPVHSYHFWTKWQKNTNFISFAQSAPKCCNMVGIFKKNPNIMKFVTTII